MLTNADPQGGNENTTIRGGIGDGNFGVGYNNKAKDLFDPTCASHAYFNFVRARGLTLEYLTVANSVTYFIRLGKVSDFVIRELSLLAHRAYYGTTCLRRGLSHRPALSVSMVVHRHITVEHITAGVRAYAINMDGARYCRVLVFKDADHPEGVGEVSDVTIQNFRFYATGEGSESLMACETNVGN